jgi:hypothetical protein
MFNAVAETELSSSLGIQVSVLTLLNTNSPELLSLILYEATGLMAMVIRPGEKRCS